MKITDKRINSENAPLTFGDLAVGDWYEYVNEADALPLPNTPRLKTDHRTCTRLVESPRGTLDGYPDGWLKVLRLDVEIIIHVNL